MLNQSEKTTSQAGTPIPTIKKELPKKNRLPMLFVLVLVVFAAFAGIGISLRQYLIRDSVAPTAPGESQASVDKIQDCSLSFDVAPLEAGIYCTKKAYRDELSNTAGDYELVQEKGTFAPGEIVVYSFVVSNTGEQTATITATDRLNINIADDVIFSYDFLDSNCGEGSYQDRAITCTAEDLLAGESETFTFRVRLSDQIDTNMILSNEVAITDGTLNNQCLVDVNISITSALCNESCSNNSDCSESGQSCINDVCRLTENPTSATCEPEVIEPSPTPETESYCNETCQSNSDCVDSDQICTSGNVCRLAENPTSATCEPEVIEPSPTPTPETEAYCNEYCATNSDCIGGDQICYFNQCRLAEYPDKQNCTPPQTVVIPTPVVEPTPAVGCNENCLSNRDCSNNDHICYEGSCRLADYPASTSCTIPSVTQQQPKMPNELPKSGSDDLINWIKAGIGILGAGALLLLL